MSRKRIFLHIGMGKTGSSSIQTVLARNSASLTKQGFMYPVTGIREEAYGMGQFNLTPLGIDHIQGDLKLLYDRLFTEFNRSLANTIILSSEFLSFASTGFIGDLAQRLSQYDVKIIFYARAQSPLLESTYLWWQKEGHDYLGDIGQFFATHADSFDLLKRILPWADVFGAEHMICRLYDREIIGENVVSDFMTTVGIHLPPEAMDSHMNPSLPACFSSLVSLLDRYHPSPSDRKKAIDEMLGIAMSIPKSSRGRLLSTEMVRRIRLHYLKPNEQFARQFLPEPARSVFLRSVRPD